MLLRKKVNFFVEFTQLVLSLFEPDTGLIMNREALQIFSEEQLLY